MHVYLDVSMLILASITKMHALAVLLYNNAYKDNSQAVEWFCNSQSCVDLYSRLV